MARMMGLGLALVAMFILGACGSQQSKLYGTWQADVALTAAKANISLPGGQTPKQNMRVIFETDGTYRKEVDQNNQSAVVEKGKWEANGTTLKFSPEQGGSPQTDTMVYELNEKEKILRLDNPKSGGRLSAVYFRRQ